MKETKGEFLDSYSLISGPTGPQSRKLTPLEILERSYDQWARVSLTSHENVITNFQTVLNEKIPVVFRQLMKVEL